MEMAVAMQQIPFGCSRLTKQFSLLVVSYNLCTNHAGLGILGLVRSGWFAKIGQSSTKTTHS